MSLVRNILLLVFGLLAFSGLAVADYYLRHEETGRTRRWLMGQGISVDTDALVKAAGAGKMDLVDALKQLGVNPGGLSRSGKTALLAALEAGEFAMVKDLLGDEKVIQTLDQKNKEGQTALSLAIKSGNFSLAKTMIKAGAELKLEREDGAPLLFDAVKRGQVELFDFLVKQGASIEVENEEGITPVIWCMREGQADWLQRLLEAGADANQAGATGEPLLVEAVQGSRRNLIQTLIAHGASVDGKSSAGESPLMIALRNKNRDVAAMLMDANAKLDGKDGEGRSIVDRLIADGDAGMVEFFARRTDGGVSDRWVVRVFEAGQAGLLQDLLVRGGNVEAVVEGGGRLLRHAVLDGNLDMVRLLLDHGANPRGEVWNALAVSSSEMLGLLLARGADANESLAVGLGSPLSLALRQRRYDAASLLLRYGADPNPGQSSGRSLLQEAIDRGDERAVAILRDYSGDDLSTDLDEENRGSEMQSQKEDDPAP